MEYNNLLNISEEENFDILIKTIFEQFFSLELITELEKEFKDRLWVGNYKEDINKLFNIEINERQVNSHSLHNLGVHDTIDNVIDYIKKYQTVILEAMNKTFYSYLHNSENNEFFDSLLSKKNIVLEKIEFHPIEKNNIKLKNLFEKLANINFYRSNIYLTELKFYDKIVQFVECNFHERLHVMNDFKKKGKQYLFNLCSFFGTVLVNGTKQSNLVIKRRLFSHCTFSHALSLSYVNIISENFLDESLFLDNSGLKINTSFIDSKIKVNVEKTSVGFYASTFKQAVQFEGNKKLNISLGHSSFYESFNFENLIINMFNLDQSKFYGIFNISGSIIYKTNFILTEFRSNFLINYTEFKNELDLSKCIFDYKPQFLNLNLNLNVKI